MVWALPSASFLFRTDQGRIDARTWLLGSLCLGGVFAVLTLAGLPLAPYTHHDLSTTPLFTWPVFAAYVYIIVYSFALILIAVCFYNLSAKRWRDRAKPGAFAGLLPFAVLLSGAAHWLRPQMGDEVPGWSVVAIDAAVVAILVWTLIELGTLPSKQPRD